MYFSLDAFGQYKGRLVSNENQCIKLKKISTIYISVKCTFSMNTYEFVVYVTSL